MQLSIVIPVHNEAGNIGPLIDETIAAFGAVAVPPSYEIVIVEDGSSDDSRAEALAAGARHAAVRVLAHAQRAGKSAALRSGFAAARGTWIAMLDGDGQNDPADLADLWPEIAGGSAHALYAGVRRARNDGIVKMATSRIANPIRRAMLRDTARDTGCGFKVMPAELARALPYFDNMHRFFPALARRHGFAVVERLVNDRPRTHGRSKYGFFDRAAVSFLDVVGVYWLIRRYSPRGPVTELAAAMHGSAP